MFILILNGNKMPSKSVKDKLSASKKYWERNFEVELLKCQTKDRTVGFLFFVSHSAYIVLFHSFSF